MSAARPVPERPDAFATPASAAGGAGRTDQPDPAPRRAVVAAALVDHLERPTRLLSARRTEPSALAGGWELPGGKVEEGEEALTALHRELREELGVAVRVGAELPGPLDGGTWPLGDRYEMRVWLAEVTEGVPAPLEDHDELRWLGVDDLRDVAWLPADLPIVERIEAVVRAG